MNQYRNYTNGVVYRLGLKDYMALYGKPTIQNEGTSTNNNVFTQLFDAARTDVDNNTNPIVATLIEKYQDIKTNIF